MSLFGLLDLGAGAIQTQSAGIAVASNNTANVATEGFSRQRLDMTAELGTPLVGGVRMGLTGRIADDMLSGRLRGSGAELGRSDAQLEALLSLEGTLSSGSVDLTQKVTDLFGRFSALSSAPLDPLTRDATVQAARELSSMMNRQAQNLGEARLDSDERVQLQAVAASGLAQDIADANRAIQISRDPVLLDQRDLAADKLAALVGGSARIDSDGQMRFVLSGGAVAVDGFRAASFETAKNAGKNNLSDVVLVDGTSQVNVTSQLNSGTMGGELYFRDTLTANMVTELDQFAFDLATQVNAVHRANNGLDGVNGRDLFVEPATPTGAAAAFAVSATVDSDSSLLATSAVGTGAGNNDGLLELLALQEQSLASGGTRTFTEEGIRMSTQLGHEVREVKGSQSIALAQRDNLDALRDSVSGVSLEDELMRLAQFQHAADASTRFLRTVDDLLGRIIERI